MARRIKVFIAVLLIFAVSVVSTAWAEDMNTVSTEEWTASAQNGMITVTYADGREAVVLGYMADELVDELLITADYNFDGRNDLAALTTMGNANGYFDVWLDTEDGFERCEALSEICAPLPNPETGRIESYERGSASEYIESDYIWQEDSLKLQMKREISYQMDGTVQITEHTPKADGMLIRQRTLTDEEWMDAQDAAARCEQALTLIRKDVNAERICVYEGMCELEGSSYYVCTVVQNYEVLYVMYVSKVNPSVLLIDSEADGEMLPLEFSLSGFGLRMGNARKMTVKMEEEA